MEGVVEQAPVRLPAPPSIWMPGCGPLHPVQLVTQVEAPPPQPQLEQTAHTEAMVEIPLRHEPTLGEDPQDHVGDLRHLIKRFKAPQHSGSNKKACRKNRRRRLAEKCRALQEQLLKASCSGPTEVETAFQPLATSTPKEGSPRPYGTNMVEDPPKGQDAMDAGPVVAEPAQPEGQVQPVQAVGQRAPVEPDRRAVQRAQVAQVYPAVQHAQVEPACQVVQSAQAEPARPMVQRTRTRLVNPKAKDYTVPVPPVRSKDPLNLRAEAAAAMEKHRQERARRVNEEDTECELIDLSAQGSPIRSVPELIDRPPLVNAQSGERGNIPFLEDLKGKYNSRRGTLPVKDVIQIATPQARLNDTVIAFALDCFEAKARRAGHKVKVFDTFFYPKLVDTGYEGVRYLLRGQDMFKLDTLLVPIHHPKPHPDVDSHWSLLAVKPTQMEIRVYDSIRRREHPEVEHLQAFMENAWADKNGFPSIIKGEDLVETVPFTGQQEPASNDCGVYLLEFARWECEGTTWGLEGKKMNLVRQVLFMELMKLKQELEAM